METGISRLNLVSPLFYISREAPGPFDYREGSGEMLFCFELDKGQYLSFEPDKEKLLGNLVFGGKAAGAVIEKQTTGGTLRQLPQNSYLFVQKREILSEEDIIGLAIEIQQEGLWQRLLPDQTLYLRYLYEDGRGVTQLFRPYRELEPTPRSLSGS